MPQCKAVTKSGNRCRNAGTFVEGYCYVHRTLARGKSEGEAPVTAAAPLTSPSPPEEQKSSKPREKASQARPRMPGVASGRGLPPVMLMVAVVLGAIAAYLFRLGRRR